MKQLALGLVFLAACSSPDHAACDDGSPAAARICHRTYPSIFQAWNPAQNLNAGPSGSVTPLASPVETTIARHDLIWKGVTASASPMGQA